MRIAEHASIGQLRMPSRVNQYSTEEELRREGQRPDLGPSDLIPMGIQTSWVNPGEAILRAQGEILPLTPIGPHATDVFPKTYPAPYDITSTDFEDTLPRTQARGDQILRSRIGVRGPGAYWIYGGGEGRNGLGQPEYEPILFTHDPSDVAYQTYKGRFLGDLSTSEAIASLWVSGTGAALVGLSFLIKNGDVKEILRWLGIVVGGTGIAQLIYELAKKE